MVRPVCITMSPRTFRDRLIRAIIDEGGGRATAQVLDEAILFRGGLIPLEALDRLLFRPLARRLDVLVLAAYRRGQQDACTRVAPLPTYTNSGPG